MRAHLALAFLLLAPPAASQCKTVESFSGGSNEGQWTWGTPPNVLPGGGNPGEFLASGIIDTIAPMGRTTPGAATVFHGDYRAGGVTSLGIDLAAQFIAFPNSCQRPLSLQLFNGNTYVYFVMPQFVPCQGAGWVSYDVPVPSASPVLPAGWAVDPNNPNAPDVVWNQIIQDVTQVQWFWGDPTFFFIFQQWNVGMDNPRIASGAPPVSYCTPGTSASGCQPVLAAAGAPSATAPTGFFVSAANVEGSKDGLFFFGTNGRQANGWGNGTSFQCVVPPVSRAGLLPGVGTNGNCDGAFAQDLNARWTAKPASRPAAGAVTQIQLWYRDPLNTSSQTTSLSSAVEVTVCP
jgi:hypothetical protein